MRTIRTLGHGTLGEAAFARTAADAGLELIVDVRRFPSSRRMPHFAGEAMARWLRDYGLDYRWVASLGGRRTPRKDSPNIALRNAQFRAYADHMATPEFSMGATELRSLTTKHALAVMCAESVWWRCHRRLLADHLVLVENIVVEHIFHDGRIIAHPVTAGARVDGDHVVYDDLDDPAWAS